MVLQTPAWEHGRPFCFHSHPRRPTTQGGERAVARPEQPHLLHSSPARPHRGDISGRSCCASAPVLACLFDWVFVRGVGWTGSDISYLVTLDENLVTLVQTTFYFGAENHPPPFVVVEHGLELYLSKWRLWIHSSFLFSFSRSSRLFGPVRGCPVSRDGACLVSVSCSTL